MKTYKNTVPALLVLTMLTSARTAHATPTAAWTQGHGDIGIAYEDGWDLHIHAEGAIIDGVEYLDDEFDPADVLIQIPDFSSIARPAGAVWAPTGVMPGASIWLLPQSEAPGVPFAGFGTEEIPLGEFVGDAISLSLISAVSPSGNGQFSLYRTDLFGTPTFFMSTSDGIDTSDLLPLNADDHTHANLGFSEQGLWAVTFEASGTHATDGFVTGMETYYFNIVPEPAAAVMCLVGGIPLVIRRRRGV